MATLLLSLLGGLLIAAGLVFMIGGAVGLLRFPDVYTRIHAIHSSDSVGAALIAIGLGVASGDGGMMLRLSLLALLLFALAPTLAFLIANAAHSAGLSPIAGRYVAPRPGTHKEDR